jgi:hypothetical protein
MGAVDPPARVMVISDRDRGNDTGQDCRGEHDCDLCAHVLQ